MKRTNTRTFVTVEAFHEWMEENHATAEGFWLKIAKKDSGHTSVNYGEAVEVALCWGWIDGQKDAFDTHWYLQYFTRRKPKSLWSKINVGKVEALIQSKRMRPPGLAEVERARADGRWKAAYDSQSRSEVPPDLKKALTTNKKAGKFFETLNSTNRYAICFRIQTAVKPETRAARIEKFVAMLARGEKLYP